MQITEVTVSTFDVPLREPLVSAAQRWERRRITLLSLRTDSGLIGLGEVATERPSGVRGVHRGQLLVLLGVDLDDVPAERRVLEALDGIAGIGRSVRSAVETALEGLAAAAGGCSLARWLYPGSRSDVAVNAFDRDPVA